ncbi:MAG: hypothetical protein KC422_00810 [Trueperaceae bacterium]|nr:hypothetical protein [Trueperaceae bacterium]
MAIQSGFSSQGNSERSSPPRTMIRGSDLLFLILAIVGSLHVMTMIGIESYRIIKNMQGIEVLQGDIQKLEAEIAVMDEINLYADDDFMEALARCQSYYYPEEQRYISDIPEETVISLACPSIY